MKFNVSSFIFCFLLVCINVYADLTEDEKTTLLELHKEARAAVNAPDMKELFWNETLADSAQQFADQCKGMVHSNTKYGENISGGYNGVVKNMFNYFLSEKKTFDESGYRACLKDSKYNGKSIWQYAQVVKARNSQVGCGKAYCEELSYKYILICHYQVRNYYNQEVYGEPGSTVNTSNTITEAQKNTLLELHRKARAAVNAPDMKELYWDDTIAESAQEFTSKCYGMVGGNSEYGESLAGNTSGNVELMFNQWMDEKEAFDESGYRANLESTFYNGKSIGPYAQIVKAKNSKFGCGFSLCENLPYLYLLICRYEVPNRIGEEVYGQPINSNGENIPTSTIKKTTATIEVTATNTLTLDDSQKETLLSLHREARKALNSPNMKDITWDDEIANGAQEYANLCKGMVHSDSEYGENLAGNSNGSVASMFNQWMAEKAAFDQSGYRANFKGTSYNGKAVGHYSQIVKARNTKIGCGYAKCVNLSYIYLLVCRYEVGNYLYEEVYAEPIITSETTTSNLPNTTTKDTTQTSTDTKEANETIGAINDTELKSGSLHLSPKYINYFILILLSLIFIIH